MLWASLSWRAETIEPAVASGGQVRGDGVAIEDVDYHNDEIPEEKVSNGESNLLLYFD